MTPDQPSRASSCGGSARGVHGEPAGLNGLTHLRLLLSVHELSAVLRVSGRHVANLRARGMLPAPVRLGRSIRWLLAEIEAWIDAGCPSREQRESMKGGKA